MAEKTRRELLAEAFDKSMGEENDDVITETPGAGDDGGSDGRSGGDRSQNLEVDGAGDGETEESADKSPKASDEKTRGKDGKFQKTKEVGKKSAPTEEEQQEAKAAAGDEAAGDRAPKEGQQSAVTDRAPQSWKPGVREHWGKIPAEARAEITRREREIQTTLSQTANIRKFANDFANVVNPFSHLIRAQHSTPLQAVQNMMQTAAALMTGNNQQKASIVAEIIQNYGVDLNELDQILTEVVKQNNGRMPNRGNSRPQEEIPIWARPLLEQNQRLQQMAQQHEETMRASADEEIAKVEIEPYFDDLRDDIADIMEFSAKRGVRMTVKQAYDKAVQLNPEISKLVQQQKNSLKNKTNGQTMTRARRAASAIAGAPSGKAAGKPQAEGEKKSRREQLLEAWENAES